MIISCKNTNIELAHSDMVLISKNSRFYYNTVSDEIVEIGFKPKSKKPYHIAICKGFDIYSTHLYCHNSNPIFVIINYGSNGHHHIEMIAIEKYLHYDYTGYFNGVERLPKCSDSTFNNLVDEMIDNAPITEIPLPYQWLYLAKHADALEKVFNKK